MARYRPIAPKPTDQQIPVKPINGENPSSSSMTQKIMESPYLRSVWPQLQARPTRTRKRGRTSVGPTAFKRLRPSNYLQPFSPYDQVSNSPAKNLSLHAFAHPPNGLPQFLPVSNFTTLNAAPPATPVTLPKVAVHPLETPKKPVQNDLDLNKAADVPEEKDLLQQLLAPTITSATTTTTTNVITPQLIRPVDSSISVESISKEPGSDLVVQGPIKAEEIEEEVESEALPVVISDSNNKVRLTNSAYKELVGQPECSWLDSMVSCGGVCKRICGEVKLQLPDSGQYSGHEPISSNGFFCLATIEWGNSGKKSSIRTSCDAVRLYCESRDYLFAWRFHTKEAADSASNV